MIDVHIKNQNPLFDLSGPFEGFISVRKSECLQKTFFYTSNLNN